MKENKVVKISLSTFFLVLAIIAIIVMGIFMYKLNIEKEIEVEKNSELQGQVNSLNETVNNLQGKIDSISNTINSNSAEKNTEDTDIIELSGNYEWDNPQGEGIECTFANGTFTWQDTKNYKGTYEIIGKTVTFKFNEEK